MRSQAHVAPLTFRPEICSVVSRCRCWGQIRHEGAPGVRGGAREGPGAQTCLPIVGPLFPPRVRVMLGTIGVLPQHPSVQGWGQGLGARCSWRLEPEARQGSPGRCVRLWCE